MVCVPVTGHNESLRLPCVWNSQLSKLFVPYVRQKDENPNFLSLFDNLCIYPAVGDPEPDLEALDDPPH